MGAKTRIPYGKRFAMFKRFLMDNSHQEHIKNLFRWWNGHVFSFEAPGTIGMENREEDSGMEEALKALDLDEEFGGDSWYVQDGPDPHHPDNLSIGLCQLHHLGAYLSSRSGPCKCYRSTPGL